MGAAALFALPAVLAWRDRRRALREAVSEVLPQVQAVRPAEAAPRREVQGL